MTVNRLYCFAPRRTLLNDVSGQLRIFDQQHHLYRYESLAFPRRHFEHTMLQVRVGQLTPASDEHLA